jgi:RNA polymerase primary sigma factor
MDRRTQASFMEIAFYVKEATRVGGLTKEQDQHIREKLLKNPRNKKAREELVKHMLGLPIQFAKKYSGCGLSFADIVQEGNIGLVKAANAYDPSKKAKFITYAYKSVYWSILAAIRDKGHIVRMPTNLLRALSDIKLGRKAKNLGCDSRALLNSLSSDQTANLRNTKNTVSLSTPSGAVSENNYGEKLEVSFLDSLKDTSSDKAFQNIDDKDYHDKLKRSLKILLKKIKYSDRIIIEQHAGLNGNPPLTFTEIGKLSGRSPQQVFLMYKRAVQSLHRMRGRVKEYA